MSVKNRLQRLTGEKETPPETAPSKVEELSKIRQRVEAILSRRPEGRAPMDRPRGHAIPLEDLIPGEEVTTDAGVFFCVHRTAPGSSRHGERCIRDLTPLDMKLVAVLANDQSIAHLDYTHGLFLDTETTGLSGGTGTVAFLIGLGWFEGGSFVTKQVFARDYAEEKATLAYLQDLLREKRFLVTFNGKAFDVNLLSTRFIMNRLRDPLTGLPHVDLLHSARRLLSHRLSDRRLGSLEESILGFSREGDIPGFEIPQRYFDWLRRRDGRLMADVFEHNRLDILSMAALVYYLADIIDPAGDKSSHHPGDLLAAGRLFVSRELNDDAVCLLDQVTGCMQGRAARDARRELSLLYKRSARWQEALALWEEMIRSDAGDVFALIELAKWCEHRAHDPARALALTRQALAHAASDSEINRGDIEHRRERLEKKLNPGPSSSGN
ncbi:MAG: ribonuclease H-like domain-containing protein [Syntrophales bacterium]|nr:ribonuclease H-like domain-containing protein [Syntrophales bacterium]